MINIETGAMYTRNFFVNEKLINDYANVTGDKNPLHVDSEFISETKFDRCIAHGGLMFGFISNVLGTEFPGPGTVYINQNLDFLQPVYANSQVKVKITVLELLPKHGAILQTDIEDEYGSEICKGIAKIKLPDWCKK